MSSVTFIVAIIVVLACLVCYAFISQTLANKREQRERLIGALTLKARNFKFMLNGFPPGFLPPELTIIVQKSLMEIHSQLAELEPANGSHKNELHILSQQMSNVRRQQSATHNIRLENPQQINEVKACLEELHKYIFQLEEKGRIPRENADAYRASIRELVVNITVDSYTIAGKQASDKDKPRLALHNLELALRLMEREHRSGSFDQRIAELQQDCAALKLILAEQDSATDGPLHLPASTGELESEWQEFEETENTWKKRQVYD
jgi:chromosome segregation ATPase